MKTKIVGILNITPDSFSDGGKFNNVESAISQVNHMLESGADVIDIGAESTRPNATPLDYQKEWQRLQEILPIIIFEVKKFNKKHNKNILTSIDSYHFETITKSYEFGIDIVNDVKGLIDPRIVEFIASKKITTILMHNFAIKNDENLIINKHINLNSEIINWAKEKIIELEKKGVKKSQLIFDPGIGFSKNQDQSIRILKNIDLYRVIEIPIYIGHSKKSFLEAIKIKNTTTRSEKTLIISKYLIKRNVDYLRVHDVLEHKKILS